MTRPPFVPVLLGMTRQGRRAHWAIPFRDAIVSAGGFVLADEWIHAKDLVAVGPLASEEAAAIGADAQA
jgi:hypothetical protein